jgi:hypothetical protein
VAQISDGFLNELNNQEAFSILTNTGTYSKLDERLNIIIRVWLPEELHRHHCALAYFLAQKSLQTETRERESKGSYFTQCLSYGGSLHNKLPTLRKKL